MRNILRDYFIFNRRERNGVFVLLSIILILILYLSFSGLFFTKEKIDFSKFEKDVSDFEAEQKRITDSISEKKNNYHFSGNALVSDSNEHADYAYEKKQYTPYQKSNIKKEKVMVELNSADTSELKSIKGIGSTFAIRIVKFRDLLGGFVKKEQLFEVYGLDKEKFDLVSPQVELDSSIVKKININSASVDDLKKHPYMNKKTAVAIFTYRVKGGDFSSVHQIRELNLVDEELYGKIAPYLKVE